MVSICTVRETPSAFGLSQRILVEASRCSGAGGAVCGGASCGAGSAAAWGVAAAWGAADAVSVPAAATLLRATPGLGQRCSIVPVVSSGAALAVVVAAVEPR